MDIKTALEQEHSKAQTQRITNYIGNNQSLFAELMHVFMGDSYHLTQRAAWTLSCCAENHPQLIQPYQQQLLTKLQESNQHDSVRRNILRIWVHQMPPEGLWGELFDVCYKLARSKDAPGAIRAFSLYILGNIAAVYKDLAGEVKELIKDLEPIGTPAILSSGRKVLKQLNKK